jgi:tetratricopeptide (TPR) repeat protein
MGRERIRSGKHVHFCVALLTLLAGCAGLNNGSEIRDSMRHGQMLLAQGDYDGSAREYQRALRFARDRSPADVALFNLGLIYMDPRNPKKDEQKAINSFAQLVASHPQSPWAAQAKIWVAVLDEKERSNKTLEKSRQATEKLQAEVDRLNRLIEISKEEVEKSRQEVEKSKQVVEKSKQALEKSNQVDIEIEQKKRERGR